MLRVKVQSFKRLSEEKVSIILEHSVSGPVHLLHKDVSFLLIHTERKTKLAKEPI